MPRTAISVNTFQEFTGIGFLLQLQKVYVEVAESAFFAPVDISFGLDYVTL
jgi:hypothetical protein